MEFLQLTPQPSFIRQESDAQQNQDLDIDTLNQQKNEDISQLDLNQQWSTEDCLFGNQLQTFGSFMDFLLSSGDEENVSTL